MSLKKIFAKEVSKKYINGVGYVSKRKFRNAWESLGN